VDDVPEDYFNTVLYTGTGAARSITGVGFQPDWVWFKRRGAVENHWLTDAVRGSTKGLFSNGTVGETTRTDQLTSFDADGFSLGADAAGYTNVSGQSYVAWNWLAGNGTSSNTDGSITSTVSVNQKAGFSVVSYTGNGVNGATTGHGLGVTPSMIILKNRSGTNSWRVYHSILGASPTQTIYLELTNGFTTDPNRITGVNSSTMSLSIVDGNASLNGSGNNYIAYCFHSVEGYSKIGSYTGNGSTDGPFVYCGFRPAWVMVKRTDSTSNWTILDSARGAYNVNGQFLAANLSNSESYESTRQADFLSNGFKPRPTSVPNNDINSSGGTYIFMAFAESPFKYANAR
jgi:hypothetical protein